jgi:hypothetical protein
MEIYNIQNIIPAGTVLNTTVNSQALQLELMYGFAIQVGWTGTVNGTFQLQASADPVTKQNLTFGGNGVVTYTPTNWSTIPNSVELTGSITSPFTWNFTGLAGYNYVRLQYTDASGGTATGTITSCTFNGKG